MEIPDLFISNSHRIEFKGHIDACGNGNGRMAVYGIRSGLEEASVQGGFCNGRLEGKVT